MQGRGGKKKVFFLKRGEGKECLSLKKRRKRGSTQKELKGGGGREKEEKTSSLQGVDPKGKGKKGENLLHYVKSDFCNKGRGKEKGRLQLL